MCLAVSGRILAIQHRPPGAAEPPDGAAAAAPPGAAPPGAVAPLADVALAGSAAAGSASDDPLWRVAEVDFGGVRQWVSLACLPQARIGDQVLVHVGIALSLVE